MLPGSMPLELHVKSPTGLLPDATEPTAAFERVWQRAEFAEGRHADSWRGIWLLPEDGGLYLKAQREPRGRGVLQRAARSYRLVWELDGLRAMAAAGVPVPELVGWGVERRLGRPVRSFTLQRRLPDVEDLGALLLRERDPAERRHAIEVVGAAVVSLHARGIFHRNLAARNVLVRPDDGTRELLERVTFIDCPRASTGAPRWRHAYLARADRLALAYHCGRAKCDEDELRAVLEACGEPEVERAIDLLRTRLARRSASLRQKAWLWLGT